MIELGFEGNKNPIIIKEGTFVVFVTCGRRFT